ncbi:MAG: hypothetical protein U0796_22025 [Gemmatales bacterium]
MAVQLLPYYDMSIMQHAFSRVIPIWVLVFLLIVACFKATMEHKRDFYCFDITVNESGRSPHEVDQEYARIREHLLKEYQKNSSFFLGVEGFDLIWGRDPKLTTLEDHRIAHGVFWVAIILATVVTLILSRYRKESAPCVQALPRS